MCGRYVIAGHQELSERFQLRQVRLDLAPTFNAAPSQLLPVVVIEPSGERVLAPMRWGLAPRWRKPGKGSAPAPINARAETLLERPMFRPLVKGRRCLIPATGFYEWGQVDGRKQPYFFTTTDQEVFAFAGLYDLAPGGEDGEAGSYTLITGAPNAVVEPIHDRMPVILRPDDEAEWLDPGVQDEGIVERLLRPYPAEAMTARPVSTAVNDTRRDGPELIEPLA